MFASTAVVASTKDALEEYLATPPTKSITDPLGYWELHMRASKKDPGAQALGRMALNFLTIPGTIFALDCASSFIPADFFWPQRRRLMPSAHFPAVDSLCPVSVIPWGMRASVRVRSWAPGLV